jgi:hypothetical protein
MERLRERDAGLRETLPTTANNSEQLTECNGVNHKKNEVNKTDDLVNQSQNGVNKRVIDAILKELAVLNPDTITPLDALALVNKWKRRYTPEGIDVQATPKPRGSKATDVTPSLFD